MESIQEALVRAMPLSLGIAASPWAILALMMVLISRRAISNAIFYILAWYGGLMAVGCAFLFIPGLNQLSGPPSGLTAWFRIGMGVFFFLMAGWLAFRIPGRSNMQKNDLWLERIERIGTWQALIAGVFMSVVNIKNASMVVAATADIGYYRMDPVSEFVALALICLVASAGVLLTLTYFLVFRKAAAFFFERLKKWLVTYRVHILLMILLVFGTLMLARGLHILKEVASLVSESG